MKALLFASLLALSTSTVSAAPSRNEAARTWLLVVHANARVCNDDALQMRAQYGSYQKGNFDAATIARSAVHLSLDCHAYVQQIDTLALPAPLAKSVSFHVVLADWRLYDLDMAEYIASIGYMPRYPNWGSVTAAWAKQATDALQAAERADQKLARAWRFSLTGT